MRPNRSLNHQSISPIDSKLAKEKISDEDKKEERVEEKVEEESTSLWWIWPVVLLAVGLSALAIWCTAHDLYRISEVM